MLTHDRNNEKRQTTRRPLYGSVWLALFELLRKELAASGSPMFNRGHTLSRQQ